MGNTAHEHRADGRLLTITEAAERITVSSRTLRTLIAMRKIPIVRVSARRVAIHPADLDAFIARRRSGSEA